MVKPVSDERVPVTVLTGFLGAGKTTLLNRILTELHGRIKGDKRKEGEGKKIAVIENEFGEVGIDDALVSRRLSSEEEIFEMNNGCICCTVRGDLIRILYKLLSRKGLKLDGVVIETTGLADPAPVAQTFFMDDTIKAKARLDGIITVVDAKHVVAHLDEEKAEGVENEAVEQIAFADKVVLNKTDLVTEQDLTALEGRIRALNSTAKIIRAVKSDVAISEVVGIHAFDLGRITAMDPSFLSDDTEHSHDQSVSSVGITCPGDLDIDKLQAWVSTLLRNKGADIYRSKGVLSVSGSPNKFVFQAVHMLFDKDMLEPWGPDEERVNKMVFIGKNLDRDQLNASFKACLVTKPLQDV